MSSTAGKISDFFTISNNKLGNGTFGCVYMANLDGDDIAVKCESKEKNILTLMREFKICRKIYIVKKYVKYLNVFEQMTKSKADEAEIKKTRGIVEQMEKNTNVKIFNYISQNDLLVIPKELDISYLYKNICVPEAYSYFECSKFNFLAMELCGDDLENIMKKYVFSERAKYFIAHRLLHAMSCVHRCGIVHRDVKLSNFVLDKKIGADVSHDFVKTLYPVMIDMGLGKEYYKYEPDRVIQAPHVNTKSITGTLRYISSNVHEFKTPTVVDDLISLAYVLVVVFTDRNLPWVKHKRDDDKFDCSKHTVDNCKCGYHKNKLNGNTKKFNTIAEMKFHTPNSELVTIEGVEYYGFLVKWLNYLYSLKPKQLPSYSYLFKCLSAESKMFDELFMELDKK